MNCKECNRQLDEDAKFCGNCGTKVIKKSNAAPFIVLGFILPIIAFLFFMTIEIEFVFGPYIGIALMITKVIFMIYAAVLLKRNNTIKRSNVVAYITLIMLLIGIPCLVLSVVLQNLVLEDIGFLLTFVAIIFSFIGIFSCRTTLSLVIFIICEVLFTVVELANMRIEVFLPF